MEKDKINNYLAEAAERILKRAEANKGHEYEGLWLTVNYAVSRGGYIKQIGPRAFGLFIVIRTYMNKQKISHPQLRTLKALTGLSINTLRKDIDILVQHGWLKKSVDKNSKGEFTVTQYSILQTDLIRGTGDPSFRVKPVSRIDNGE